MVKRTWIVMAVALALGIVLSACGSGDLAKDLTPIPTLPPGDEPELVEALQAVPVAVAETSETSTADGSEDSGVNLVALGEQIFTQTCSGCHMAEDGVGPALTGMADRAAERVEGMSAKDYLHESIVEPGAFVAEGFQNIMPASYGDDFDETELKGLVAYIMVAGSEGEIAPATEEPTEEPTAEAEDEAEEPAETEEPPAEAEATEEPPTEEPAAEAEEPSGDPAAGETIFASACAACHGAEDGVGPSLTGIDERAAEQVEGISAEDYIHESIVDPGAFVVEGYGNIMPGTYAEQYSEAEIADIIAYILTQ
ncbi:MAG: cytochrome c [Anaerolineae bacterium]|nr:cytochrome c [Anaerolineae bacterium]